MDMKNVLNKILKMSKTHMKSLDKGLECSKFVQTASRQ